MLADGEHLGPALSSIRRLEQPASIIGPPQRAKGRHVNGLGVFRVDENPTDVARLLEPHVLPGLAAVFGPVHPITVGRQARSPGLTRSHPNDVRIGGSHRNRPEGAGSFPVEHRLPGRAVVGRLPGSTGRRRRVDDVGIALDHGEIVHAPAWNGRADTAPRQVFEDRRVQDFVGTRARKRLGLECGHKDSAEEKGGYSKNGNGTHVSVGKNPS